MSILVDAGLDSMAPEGVEGTRRETEGEGAADAAVAMAPGSDEETGGEVQGAVNTTATDAAEVVTGESGFGGAKHGSSLEGKFLEFWAATDEEVTGTGVGSTRCSCLTSEREND